MSAVELIPVRKGGEYIEVHPVALAQHKKLGWRECERVDTAPTADPPEAAPIKARKAKTPDQEPPPSGSSHS